MTREYKKILFALWVFVCLVGCTFIYNKGNGNNIDIKKKPETNIKIKQKPKKS